MQGIRRAKNNVPDTEKVLDVNASMQGTMIFKDPVNLRISGEFEGKLETKGTLTIGSNAHVKADIDGEDITIAGKVTGNITATIRLNIIPPAQVIGDISTPVLGVSEGAILNGRCSMSVISDHTTTSSKSRAMALDEVARYLEVDVSLVEEWASQKKIPAIKENNAWKFHKQDIDSWLAKEKVGR
ncbi:MAG: helix-turn-helix domain-containing protein [Dehalococcoidia bacterium]|nr:MAG: helix-turn-helix domain-containing protein [Dehalococcoidia bacterium]